MRLAALILSLLIGLAFYAGLYALFGWPGVIIFTMVMAVVLIYAMRTAIPAPRQYLDLEEEDKDEN